jgi:transcriptional regulator with GAF, ATPase, and Fis domain
MFNASRDGFGRHSANAGLRVVTDRNAAICEFIGSSSNFIAVLEDVRTVEPVNCPVLIQGETGTGKEVTARGHS